MGRLTLPYQSVFNLNGKSLDGAKLYFYKNNTNEAKDTFSVSQLTVGLENANPVVANNQGQFGDIFLNGLYRVELRDKNEVVQPNYPADDVGLLVTNNKYSVLDFGVTVDGVTDDTTNYQTAVDYVETNGGGYLEQPAGTSIVTTLTGKSTVIIIGAGKGISKIKSSTYPVITFTDTNLNDIGILDITLETTLNDSTNHDRAIYDLNTGSFLDGCQVKRCGFIGLNTGVNGLLFKSSDTGRTELGRSQNIDIENNSFQTGRMGVEFVNHSSTATITNITIAAPAVLTANNFYALEGMFVKLSDIVGTGAVDDLNDEYYQVTNPSGIGPSVTFNLLKADGTTVATTGGTYTSGGDAEEFRYDNVNIINNDFIQTGNVQHGMGVSLSGAGHSCDVTNNKFRDNPTTGVEIVGAHFSTFNDNKFINASGDVIQSSGANHEMEGNVINSNTCIGFANGSVQLGSQKNLICESNSFRLGVYMSILTSDSLYKNNIVITEGVYAIIVNNKGGNEIDGGILDNSRQAANFSCLRFFNTGAIGNIAKNLTIIKGTGGATFDESGGATDNTVHDYRTSSSSTVNKNLARSDILDYAPVALGEAATWIQLYGSSVKHASNYDTGSGKTAVRLKHNTATPGDGQPITHTTVRWAGRNNDIPVGGMFTLTTGTNGDYDVDPILGQLGSTVVLGAVAYDGSSFPYWDIAFPTNNGATWVSVESYIRDADESLISITTV